MDSSRTRPAVLARLFFEFFKISLFVVGGGYAILAVADRVFSGKLKWTKEGELIEELPVLQMIPGLIAGNTAIYVGHKMAGRLGAAVALMAVALPSFAIFLAVTCGLAHLPMGNPWVIGALEGARCALTGILAGTVWKAWRKNVSGLYGPFAAVAATVAILVFGVNTALVLLVAMLFGLGLELRGRTFNIRPDAVNGHVALPLGCVAAGMLLPAVLSLWRSVEPGKRVRIVLRILSVLLLIPIALMALYLLGFGWPPRSGWAPLNRAVVFILAESTGFRRRLFLGILPFFAGLCLYPAWVRLRRAGE